MTTDVESFDAGENSPRSEFFRLLMESSHATSKEFMGAKFPMALDGADEVKLIGFLPPADGAHFLQLAVRLYTNGEEYNLPGDEELEFKIGGFSDLSGSPQTGHLYTVCASSELPPFIVAIDRIESLPPKSADEEIVLYLLGLINQGLEPRNLSDEECDALVAGATKELVT